MAHYKVGADYLHCEHHAAHGCSETGGHSGGGSGGEDELCHVLAALGKGEKGGGYEHAADDDCDVDVGAFAADLKAGGNGEAETNNLAEEAR